MQIVLCILACVGVNCWEFTFCTSHVSVRNSVRFFDPSVGLQETDLPANPHLSLSLSLSRSPHTHITYMRYILVMFEQWLSTLYWHNNVSSGCIWTSSGRIFLTICVLDPTNTHNIESTADRLLCDCVDLTQLICLHSVFKMSHISVQ